MSKHSPFYAATLLLAFIVPAQASSPVHAALKAQTGVAAVPDGFFTLGQVADLSGGETSLRGRLAAVPVGRIPLSGDTRRLTVGDVALKLRQAGFQPDKDVVLEGARQMAVTAENPSQPSPSQGEGKTAEGRPAPTPSNIGGAGGGSDAAGPPLVHRGDAVTILVQSDALTITAKGISREDGRAGDTIRVHREGVMTDLTVTVVDAQTVQLEL